MRSIADELEAVSGIGRYDMGIAAIRSEGDLEVALLHEAHSALAQLINPELYSIGGEPLAQTALFNNSPCFDLFFILLVEFFSEGRQVALINDRNINISLFGGLGRFCELHQEESTITGLSSSVSVLAGWIDKLVPIKFWCPEVDSEVEFPISNKQLIWFGANTTKHHLLRLSGLLGKLEELCIDSGYNFTPQELYAVLNAMIEEVRSRLQYHSTYILEMLGGVFLDLNSLITKRFEANPTNRTTEMNIPDGVTSEVFRDMYGSVLVFKRYSRERIVDNTPSTTKFLKMRYQ